MRSILKRKSDLTLVHSLGISLVSLGVPLGMYGNYLFPIVKWSPLFMALSLLLIISYKNLINFKFPLFNKYFAIIIGFQAFMLFYGILSENLTGQYLSFHLYIITLCISLSTLNTEMLKNYRQIILFIFYISGALAVLGSYYMFKGLVVGETAWEMKQGNADYALEPFTVAGVSVSNLLALLCIKFDKYKKINIILAVLFLTFDFYLLFSSTKRTPIFVCIICFLTWSYMKGYIHPHNVYFAIKWFVILLFVSVFTYITIPWLKDSVDNFATNFYYGVLNLFGNTEVMDKTGSAMARVESREWAYNFIDNYFTLPNYIFGAGYMTRWLDNPILQSYLDMGVLGFIGYFYLIVIFPSYFIIRKFTKSNIYIWATLLCIYNIVSIINSGNPYIFGKYTSLCILAFVIGLLRKNNINRLKNVPY